MFAPDLMRFTKPAPLGKELPGEGAVRCVVRIDPRPPGRNVVIHARTSGADLPVLIFNGHLTSGSGNIHRNLDVSVTPWVKPGEDDEILFVTGKATLREVTIETYASRKYP